MTVAFLGKEAALPHFFKWFRKAGAADYTDVANAATSMDKYDDAVIEVMISENVEGAKNLGNKAAL